MNRKVLQMLMGVVIVVTTSATLAAPASGGDFPDWSRLSFKYSTFAIKAKTDLVREVIGSADFMQTSTSVPGQLLPSGGTVARITTNSTFDLSIFGSRRSEALLWFDPVSFAALQSSSERVSRSPRVKTSRYAESGVHRSKVKPANRAERRELPESWTNISQSFVDYSLEPGKCVAVTEPIVLLYILSLSAASTSSLDAGICILSDERLHRLVLSEPREVPQQFDYRVHSADGVSETISSTHVLHYTLESTPVGESQTNKDEPVSFLGLKGNIQFYIDEHSNVPLQVRGSTSLLGRVKFRLTDMWLTEDQGGQTLP